MPDPGVAHNLVMVRIRKTYPGQGMKVINSLFGAGQMMFTKYLLVVSGDINIRNYDEVLNSLLKNTDFGRDILFFSGPLDVLDHSSDRFASGGKAGIDATVKTSLERTDETGSESVESRDEAEQSLIVMKNQGLIQDFRLISPLQNRYIAIISAVISAEKDTAGEIAGSLAKKGIRSLKLAILVDHAVDIDDNMMVAWQLLGNSDPRRDHYYIAGDSVLLDGTIKEGRHKPFPRSWPNAVCSSGETISWIDELWTGLGFEKFIPSPSLKYKRLLRPGNEEILKNPRNTV
jgi:4-hydroxy-3-polyprenylbenzoate decarboxylase